MPTALLSVYHKEGIIEFAQELLRLGWDLIASGGTAKTLLKANLPVEDVAVFVGGEAILGHRVVTLSREIHAGLLARPEDAAEMKRLGLRYIDLTCVDLYPMQKAIDEPNATLESVIEMTDIGGPTLLRAAAKGNRIVIADPTDRMKVIQWLKDGQPDRNAFINSLAAKAEYIVAAYALASACFRSNGQYDGFFGKKVADCCYGENQWQSPAALFSTGTSDPLALERFRVLQGSAPSYVNWRDIDRLLQTTTHIAAGLYVNGLDSGYPYIAVGCKHGNPCGAAIGSDPDDVAMRMAQGDPLALFGGLVMTNFVVTEDTAKAMLHNKDGKARVLDGVAAPNFTHEAVDMLRRKNDRCRLYMNSSLLQPSRVHCLNPSPLFVPVHGGFLRQPNYTFVLDLKDPQLEVVSQLPLYGAFAADIVLAWAIGATSNSNTVTLVKYGQLIGNGVGQQDRVGCCALAIHRAHRAGHDTDNATAYSDSFFPFTDGPEHLARDGIAAILASSGSIRDNDVKAFCQERNITLLLIPDAHGRGFFGH